MASFSAGLAGLLDFAIWYSGYGESQGLARFGAQPDDSPQDLESSQLNLKPRLKRLDGLIRCIVYASVSRLL